MDQQEWDQHEHASLVHTHPHHHVTHNLNQRTGYFDHLSSEHDHDHDHAAVSHAHYRHQDFDSEHRSEAHDHDHGEPVKERKPRKAAPKKTAPKRAPAGKGNGREAST